MGHTSAGHGISGTVMVGCVTGYSSQSRLPVAGVGEA